MDLKTESGWHVFIYRKHLNSAPFSPQVFLIGHYFRPIRRGRPVPASRTVGGIKNSEGLFPLPRFQQVSSVFSGRRLLHRDWVIPLVSKNDQGMDLARVTSGANACRHAHTQTPLSIRIQHRGHLPFCTIQPPECRGGNILCDRQFCAYGRSNRGRRHPSAQLDFLSFLNQYDGYRGHQS